MADPTLDAFKAEFPQFTAVEEPVFAAQLASRFVQGRVDASWGEDEAYGKMLLVAHRLGTATDALVVGATHDDIIAEFGPGVTKLKAGDTEVSFGSGGAQIGTGLDPRADGLHLTTWGAEFVALQRRLFAGPRVLSSFGGPLSGAATDWPI